MQHNGRGVFITCLAVLFLAFSTSGCTVVFQKGRRADMEKISKLKSEIDELGRAKQELEKRLKTEINDNEVTVERQDKGLVITFVAEVLFDSGKDKLRADSLPKLDKVAKVLQDVVPDLNVGIEGHTDNDPIKKSGWKSNWELSTARALSVLHYLVERDVTPARLSSTGYGEYRPVAPNDTREGKQKNRRVEIVILPPIEKSAAEAAAPVSEEAPTPVLDEPTENLK